MKKTRSRWYLGCLLTLAAAGSAIGAFNENMAYFNVVKGHCELDFMGRPNCNNDLYLSQSATGCKEGVECLKSVGPFTTAAEVNEALAELVGEVWNDKNNVPLHLASDIDLGGFDANTAAESCDAQLHPLPFLYNQAFQGDNKIIKNLCYVHDIKDSVMSGPVGFFSYVPRGYMGKVLVKNVRIIIKDSREDRDPTAVGKDFYPVGSFVGMAAMSTIENVTLEDVTISAPIAGGVAGYVGNSTVRNILATDDLVVSNDIEITPYDGNFAGNVVGEMYSNDLRENYSTWPSEYTVFLGGVVGMAVQDSLYNIRVRGKVRDYSSMNTPSALGGLAGILAYKYYDYASFNDTLDFKPAGPDSGAGYTTISGGRAMGGLFGEVAYMPFGAVRDFTISNAVVGKVRIMKGMSDNVYAGGLVGRATFNNVTGNSNGLGNLFKIENSSATVDISDSLTSDVSYHYYAGGLLGTTTECSTVGIANNDNDAFVSIVGSTSKGAIRVAASAAAVTDLEAEVFLGGVAGSACFTAGADAINNVSSSVEIESAVKTGSENVFVGGIVGKADVFRSNKTLAFKNARFDGSLVAADSTDKVHMGGILGGFMTQLRSVSFDAATVAANVTLKSDGVSGAEAEAYVGGICGYCAQVAEVLKSSVTGNVSVVDENFGGKSLLVGGLFGLVQSNLGLTVKNTFSVGDISVKPAIPANVGMLVGYIAGRAEMTGTLASKLISNYHFSTVDDVDAFGKVVNGETDITASWKNGVTGWTISYNVRNGETESLSSDKNGLLLAADMMVDEFAGELNRGQKPNYVWTREKGVNRNLPFITNGTGIAPEDDEVYLVTFIYYVWDAEAGKFISKNHSIIAPSGAKVSEVAPEVPPREGHTFTGWDKGDMIIESMMTVTAQYAINTYTVVFKIGQYEQSKDWPYDSIPAYEGETPTKASDDRFDYTFAGWSPEIVPVTKPAVYTAVFDSVQNKYRIRFVYQLGTVTEGEVATGTLPVCDRIPELPATAGYTYTFKGWSPEIAAVTSDQTYMAVFDSTIRTYYAKFVVDGVLVDSIQVNYGEVPVFTGETPARDSANRVVYTFTGWNPGLGPIPGDMTYHAEFRADTIIPTYTVTFVDYLGVVLSVQTVKEGESAVAPKYTEPEGTEFIGWSTSFENVTRDLLVFAFVKTAEPQSSSSILPGSSSDVVPGSSGIVPSSSSEVVPESSSSSVEVVELAIVEPKIEQSGNAIRLTFGTKFADAEGKVSARVQVYSNNGTVIDTVVVDSVTALDSRLEWELAPAPLGKSKVVLTLEGSGKPAVYETSFVVASEIAVTPRSWQMVSLAALDMEVSARSEDDALYWWDEENPVGEYWQYRSYRAGEKNDPSRGYWYGTRNGNPLLLKEESPTEQSEIVWELDSVYSGWNLVANPHGWYIDLSSGKGGDVQFWRWNSANGEYEASSVLGPYEAVWAKVAEPTTWTVSAKPVYEFKKLGTAMQKAALAKAAGDDWSVRVVLSDEFGKQDSWNFIASGKPLDVEEPPAGMGDHVNLSIVEGGKFLAKSAKAPADEYVWNMEVSASDYRDGFLKFEGVSALAAKGLRLFVTVAGKTTEVAEGKSVKVLLKQSSTPVTVRVARSGAAVAAKASLGELRMVQRTGFVDVGFEVPADMAGASVQVDIVSLDGKVVDRSKFTASAGTNLATLAAPHRGLYYVRVRAGSLAAIKKTMIK